MSLPTKDVFRIMRGANQKSEVSVSVINSVTMLLESIAQSQKSIAQDMLPRPPKVVFPLPLPATPRPPREG
jgi:hypothetical protein